MPENNEKPETTQEKPNTDAPDFDSIPPDIEYVQNDYKPDLEHKDKPLYEKRNK